MYTGGCLCGSVRFEIRGAVRTIVYCHCSQCRKAQGSAFATNGIVNADEFEIVAGIDALTAYESTPGQIKYFCATCGSPIMSTNMSRPTQVRVRLGTIESAIVERPGAHIFVSSKAEWDAITDELPQYEGHEPGRT